MKIVCQEFAHRFDRGGSRIEDVVLERCQAFDCHFSLTTDLSQQSVARCITLDHCRFASCSIGPAILEDIAVHNLSTSGPLICWSPFLHHVRFTGRNGRVLINDTISLSESPAQDLFEEARRRYYLQCDWALDISDALFDELDIRGIPADVIQVNPVRHAILRRKNAMQSGWRERVRSKSTFWVFCIDSFLRDRDDSTVLVMPEKVTKSEYRELADSMSELRDLGVLT